MNFKILENDVMHSSLDDPPFSPVERSQSYTRTNVGLLETIRSQQALRSVDAAPQAILKLFVATAALHVFGDCSANHLRNRSILHGGNSFESFSLLGRKPNRHRFRMFHSGTMVP